MNKFEDYLKGESRLMQIDSLIAQSMKSFRDYWHFRNRSRQSKNEKTQLEYARNMKDALVTIKQLLNEALKQINELESLVDAELDNH